jgi:hypothetical protein
MYPFSAWYVCKLDSWAHILCAFSLALKLGVTEWYQSHIDHSNASLVRRVIFWMLFYNQNYFYTSLFKIFIFILIFKCYLSLLSRSTLEKVLPTFSKSLQKFWHLQVYIFAFKHNKEMNMRWRSYKRWSIIVLKTRRHIRMKRWKSHSIFTTSQNDYPCTSSLRHFQQWCWLGAAALG